MFFLNNLKEIFSKHINSNVSSMIYILYLAADGGYSNWTRWSNCSTSCGDGVMTRSRHCNNPSPAGHDAKNCSGLGPREETRKCYLKPCHGNLP